MSGRRSGLLAAMARSGLCLAEIPYRWTVVLRNHGFDTGFRKIHQLKVPVISVGNLTLGGTGKTPTVAWLARYLREHRLRPAIVSRGYKGRSGAKNDEALELAEKLPGVPHIQNPDRWIAARSAIEQHAAQAILLDDGFQHRRLDRDLDLVLVDALEPFGFEQNIKKGVHETERAFENTESLPALL